MSKNQASAWFIAFLLGPITTITVFTALWLRKQRKERRNRILNRLLFGHSL